MYNNDDIQKMIDAVNINSEKKKELLDLIEGSDRLMVSDVLSRGWYEDFDRYDSAVCEHFIDAYEKVFMTNTPVVNFLKHRGR